jgi:hypothetical protein
MGNKPLTTLYPAQATYTQTTFVFEVLLEINGDY